MFRRIHDCLQTRTLLIAVLLAALVLVGCQPEPTATPIPTATPEPEPLVLGVALSNMNTFFATSLEAAEVAAERTGATIELRDAGDDLDTQLEQMQELIDMEVDALLVNAVDADAVVPLVEAANEADIPVFTFDRSVSGGDITSHIASDNVAGGQIAGDYMVEILNGEGNVIELQGVMTASAAQDRGQGFNEAIADEDGITLLAQVEAGWTREGGEEVFAELLEEYDDIDGVFAHNDEMILGAIEAAKAAGRADEIEFIGFDAVEDAIVAIENGELRATVAQQPAEMGRITVEAAVAHLNGEDVDAAIPVDLALITE